MFDLSYAFWWIVPFWKRYRKKLRWTILRNTTSEVHIWSKRHKFVYLVWEKNMILVTEQSSCENHYLNKSITNLWQCLLFFHISLSVPLFNLNSTAAVSFSISQFNIYGENIITNYDTQKLSLSCLTFNIKYSWTFSLKVKIKQNI